MTMPDKGKVVAKLLLDSTSAYTVEVRRDEEEKTKKELVGFGVFFL